MAKKKATKKKAAKPFQAGDAFTGAMRLAVCRMSANINQLKREYGLDDAQLAEVVQTALQTKGES